MIEIKTAEQIDKMRRANLIVAEVLEELAQAVRPGVSTGELDRIAEALTRKRGARPAFKGYVVCGRTFPRSVCISINDEIVHGIPSDDRLLRDGDIVGLDFGVVYEGFYGDSARTVPVGRVDAADAR
jgi:methionyl aminopeptidase